MNEKAAKIFSNARIYKIVSEREWIDFLGTGVFVGSPIDLKDGFIHFSSFEQLPGTIAKYFSGRHDLIILEVDTTGLGDGLRWEPSRDGQLFPHLYAELSIDQVIMGRPHSECVD